MSEIKDHAFFKDVDWLHMFKKKVEPPYLPDIDYIPAIDLENVQSNGIYTFEYCEDDYEYCFKEF